MVRCLVAAGGKIAETRDRLGPASAQAEDTNNPGVYWTDDGLYTVDEFSPVLADGEPVGGHDYTAYVVRTATAPKRYPSDAVGDGDAVVVVIQNPQAAHVEATAGCLGE